MELTLDITGTRPLLMHSARLSDPIDPAARALAKVTGKRKKTEDDHREAARLEWIGGLYYDPEVGPYVPGDNIWRSLYDAAKKTRRGPSVKEGVFVTSDTNPIGYSGPRGLDDLMGDESFKHRASVKVGTSRVMRTRPIFRNWRTSATLLIDTSLIDPSDLQDIANTAGQLVGLGDWRPRFGTYTVEVSA